MLVYLLDLRELGFLCTIQAKAAVLSLLSHIPLPEIPHGEEGLFESIYLLLTSVIVVPLVCKLPGGSPVLGFLVSPSPLFANVNLRAS